MKIAFIQEFLVKLGGAERVLKTLSDLYPEAPIFTLFYQEEKVGKVFPKEKIQGLPLQKLYKLTKRQRLLLPLLPSSIESLDFSGYDVVISSNTAIAHNIVTNLSTKHICYCHSPVRYVWDYYHQYKKENRIQGFKDILATKLIHQMRIWDKGGVDRVDHWIANSHNVQKRIYKYYGESSTLIYPPVDTERFSLSPTHENYFLIVSTLTSYKRIDLAIRLFNRIGRKLVIIGDGEARESLESIAGDTIEFLGYQSDTMIQEYMMHCRGLIFPGEDDFGIVPVEAMACGKPVIAFAKGGSLETVIEGITGEFFEEPTPESMEQALVRFFLHEKNYDSLKIREHAMKFDKKIFEEKMKKLIENYA